MGREAVAVQRICPSSRAATTGALRVKWQLSSRCTTTTKGKSRRTSFRGARRPSTLSNCTTAAATTSTTRSPQTTFPRSTRAGGATGKTKSGISRRCGRRWVMTPHFLCRCNDCPGALGWGNPKGCWRQGVRNGKAASWENEKQLTRQRARARAQARARDRYPVHEAPELRQEGKALGDVQASRSATGMPPYQELHSPAQAPGALQGGAAAGACRIGTSHEQANTRSLGLARGEVKPSARAQADTCQPRDWYR